MVHLWRPAIGVGGMIRFTLMDVSQRDGVMNSRDKQGIRDVVTQGVIVFSGDITSIIKVRIRGMAGRLINESDICRGSV